jgi:aminoglycoside phosphotransferase (APT) family kinase protein
MPDAAPGKDQGAVAEALRPALRRLGLVEPGEAFVLRPLTGGVASDIWRVETPRRRFVVKRALEKLRVAADWHAPVERSAYEVAWLAIAGEAAPGSAPTILGHDPASGLFAMAYLEPRDHPVWKGELLAGRVDPGFAEAVGRRIAAVHAATAGRADLAARFDTLHIFRPIRLDAYLGESGWRHPALADRFEALIAATAATRIALVHGDVSPKNILVGPQGPVFLDAECAWYGDPAFDLAFCLNHLLLKRIARPDARTALGDSALALEAGYLAGVSWEERARLEARAAALLPALLVARVDGKSPVEYITDDAARERVRAVALPLVADPVARLAEVRARWDRAWPVGQG